MHWRVNYWKYAQSGLLVSKMLNPIDLSIYSCMDSIKVKSQVSLHEYICMYVCSIHTVYFVWSLRVFMQFTYSEHIILHVYVCTSNKSALHVEMPAMLLRSAFHLIDPHY